MARKFYWRRQPFGLWGIVVKMGDVFPEPMSSNMGVHITRVTGMFK